MKGDIFAVDEYVRNIKEAFQKVRDTIKASQEKQKRAVDKLRRPMEFKEDAWVILKFPKARLRQKTGKDCNGLPTGHQKYYANLAKCYYGPCQILERINEMGYRSKLAMYWQIHNAFLVSLLKPYKGEPPTEPILEDPPDIDQDEEIL